MDLEQLCEILRLGKLLRTPIPLTGGLLHKMFAIETESGKYAVKALNPQIMARPEAMQNMLMTERIAGIAAISIPAIPAIVFDCGVMPEIDGQFYLAFNWIDGKTLLPTQIELEHCRAIGKILADLHSVDFSSLDFADTNATEPLTDWYFHLRQAETSNFAWVELLRKNIDNLYHWNERAILASESLNSNTVISHRDLDPKNVMWCGITPTLIDWEAAGPINPLHDLVETALYWATDATGLHTEKFKTFIAEYQRHLPTECSDWQPILDMGFNAKLEWLEYNLNRALALENSGVEQVTETLQSLQRYALELPAITTLLETTH